jgi:ribosomal protein L32
MKTGSLRLCYIAGRILFDARVRRKKKSKKKKEKRTSEDGLGLGAERCSSFGLEYTPHASSERVGIDLGAYARRVGAGLGYQVRDFFPTMGMKRLTTMELEMAWQLATQAGGRVSGARVWRTQSDRASSSFTLDAMTPKKKDNGQQERGYI